MAGNPYHDANGKFCSKEEMQTAIDNLAKEGKIEEYLKLREEFQEIEENKKSVTEELLRRVLSESSANVVQDSDELEIFIDNWLTKLKEEDKDNEMLGEQFSSMYDNEYITDELKQKLIDNLDDDIRYQILTTEEYNFYTYAPREQIMAIIGDSKDEKVLQTSLGFGKLEYDDKLEYSKGIKNGLIRLAIRYPVETFNRPELVEKIEKEMYELDSGSETIPAGSGESHRYVLAAHSPKQDIHNYILEGKSSSLNSRSRVLNSLLSNEKLTIQNAVTILEEASKKPVTDMYNFETMYKTFNKNKLSDTHTFSAPVWEWSANNSSLKNGSAPEELRSQLKNTPEGEAKEALKSEILSYKENYEKAVRRMDSLGTMKKRKLTEKEQEELKTLRRDTVEGFRRAAADKIIATLKTWD